MARSFGLVRALPLVPCVPQVSRQLTEVGGRITTAEVAKRVAEEEERYDDAAHAKSVLLSPTPPPHPSSVPRTAPATA
jgi:hypothetical protein